MDRYMKGIWFPVIFVSAFLAVYVLFAYFKVENVVITMFLISPFLVIWMVYKVLKDGTPSGKTFSEHFYDDSDYKRIPDQD
jgi:hypothetical protein